MQDSLYYQATQMGMLTLMHLIELEIVETAIIAAHGNRTEAAETLGINRTTLIMKLRKFKMLEKYPSPHDRTINSISNQTKQ